MTPEEIKLKELLDRAISDVAAPPAPPNLPVDCMSEGRALRLRQIASEFALSVLFISLVVAVFVLRF